MSDPLQSFKLSGQPQQRSRVNGTSGFTLLELLLSIAILSALAAVVIPQVGWVLGDRRLVAAADQLRVEMTRLRVKAMREGRVMMMEGMVEGGNLRIRPFYSLADSMEAFDQTGSQSALLSGAQQASVAVVAPNESAEQTIELPEDVMIESVGVVSSARSLEIEQVNLSNQSQGWSQAVLFYPDGTTSTAVIVLKHQTHGRLGVKLRGITGDVTIDQLEGSQ